MTKYSRDKHTKKQIQSQFSGPVYGNKACKLCKNGYVENSDRSTYVGQYTTCGDIHLQLSHKKESDDGQCASGMEEYIPICCQEETTSSSGGMQIDLGLSTLVITGLLVFFGCRRRMRRIAAEKHEESLPITYGDSGSDSGMGYKRMKDSAIEMRNSERNPSIRSARSFSRTRSRSRSKARNRSKSMSNSERETVHKLERRRISLEGSRRGRSPSIHRGRSPRRGRSPSIHRRHSPPMHRGHSPSIHRAPSPSILRAPSPSMRGTDFKRVPTLLV